MFSKLRRVAVGGEEIGDVGVLELVAKPGIHVLLELEVVNGVLAAVAGDVFALHSLLKIPAL